MENVRQTRPKTPTTRERQMMGDTPEKTRVLEFVEAINDHDVDRVLAMMTDDHVFVDSGGNAIEGKNRQRTPWQRYFEMFPDYHVTVRNVLQENDVVGVFGLATGTLASAGEISYDRSWKLTAAWRAELQGDRIARWQVYADNEPIRRIMARNDDEETDDE